MKVIIKIFRTIFVFLSFAMLVYYYIITSEVPPIVSINDVIVFAIFYLSVFLFEIIDYTNSLKYEYYVRYIILISELMIFVMWVLSYVGMNFSIGNINANYYISFIIFGGIISNFISIVFQLLALIKHFENHA